jgi:homoserine kinase
MVTRAKPGEFHVSVPASCGNIGPGFDVLGMALSLRNELYVRVRPGRFQPPVISIVGQGADSLPKGPQNIVFKALRSVFHRARKPVPALDMICVNRIPLARGLGSSAAAIVAGLLAGNGLSGGRFSRDQILTWASEMEGHPDNVAPALFGGVRASGALNGGVASVAWPVPALSVVVAVPSFELRTAKARGVLPKNVPLKDAIHNLSAVALLADAFHRAPERLETLLDDRWHEPYRAKLVPGFYQVKKAALAAGAAGTVLSGAGPTVLSLTSPRRASAVGHAMAHAFQKAGVRSQILHLSIDEQGASLDRARRT